MTSSATTHSGKTTSSQRSYHMNTKCTEADGHTEPLPAFSSLLVDLGIFFSDVSDLVDFLSSVLWPLTSPWPLSSVPGVVALCRSGEGGYWPGEQGDWARLLFDLTLNTNTTTSGHLDSNPGEVCRCYLCVCVLYRLGVAGPLLLALKEELRAGVFGDSPCKSHSQIITHIMNKESTMKTSCLYHLFHVQR